MNDRTTLKHLPSSTTDLQLLSAEIKGYMASGEAGWWHTIGVLFFVGCWKHAWSVPSAVVLVCACYCLVQTSTDVGAEHPRWLPPRPNAGNTPPHNNHRHRLPLFIQSLKTPRSADRSPLPQTPRPCPSSTCGPHRQNPHLAQIQRLA